ncbi:MAG TPA: vitamin K epoxide reductase family protein [Solirubrobacteraceae bacterium]|nr:vitamin K epoxide reductase family protein [Solirubrobacteraceae bacterium]
MSARTLRLVMIVLTAVGLGVASYLTYVHYSGATPLCSIKGNPCSQVQKSQYSELVGVPVALIGLIGYVAIMASLLVPESETSRLATAAFTVIGFGFSAYLTYRELFTLHKICEWCVSSAVIVTVLMCLAVWRFLRGEVAPRSLGPADSAEAEHEPASSLGAARS